MADVGPFERVLELVGLEGIPLRDQIAAAVALRLEPSAPLRIAAELRRSEAMCAIERGRVLHQGSNGAAITALAVVEQELALVAELAEQPVNDAEVAERLDAIAAAWAEADDRARGADVASLASALRSADGTILAKLHDLTEIVRCEVAPKAASLGRGPSETSESEPARDAAIDRASLKSLELVDVSSASSHAGIGEVLPPAERAPIPRVRVTAGRVAAAALAVVGLAGLAYFARSTGSSERMAGAGSASPGPTTAAPLPSINTAPMRATPRIPLGEVQPGRTKVPKLAEWRAVRENPTGQNGCYYKVLREWLKLGCGHDALPKGISDVSGLGSNGHDYFIFEQADRIVDVVARMVPGQQGQGRFQLAAAELLVGYDWHDARGSPELVWEITSGAAPQGRQTR